MTSASTYLIDATAADPVIVPADMYQPYQNGYGPSNGFAGGGGRPNGYGYPPKGYAAGNGFADGFEEEEGVGRPGGGHCNHMNDTCQCFKQNYIPSRKVKRQEIYLIVLWTLVRNQLRIVHPHCREHHSLIILS